MSTRSEIASSDQATSDGFTASDVFDTSTSSGSESESDSKSSYGNTSDPEDTSEGESEIPINGVQHSGKMSSSSPLERSSVASNRISSETNFTTSRGGREKVLAQLAINDQILSEICRDGSLSFLDDKFLSQSPFDEKSESVTSDFSLHEIKEAQRSLGTTLPPDPANSKPIPGESFGPLTKSKPELKAVNPLPPQLVSGWGEEPEPAPWEWQAMPFDYMGILAEQRRTVFYEFRERDGKGEWTLPNYEGRSLLKFR